MVWTFRLECMGDVCWEISLYQELLTLITDSNLGLGLMGNVCVIPN